MDKVVIGILISFVFLLFQIPNAAAVDAKAATPHKSGKKKIQVKRKAQVAAVDKARKPPVRRSARPAVEVRKRNVKSAVKVISKRKVAHQHQRMTVTRAAPRMARALTAGDLAGLHSTRDPLMLNSNVALVMDALTSRVLFEKNSDVALPIASITKLMTGLIVVESGQDMHEVLEVTSDDIDREKHTSSRLRIGAKLSRADMLHIALMSSENRAASALGRNYPGGLRAFVAAMNVKARALGMSDTRYVEPTGLSSRNVASASDLAKLVLAAHRHPVLRQYSTNGSYAVDTGGYTLQYANSNRLVRNADWEIGLQKTGFINEAGRCLVMQVEIEGRPVVMVFLDSKGPYSRFADASRVRKWMRDKADLESTVHVKLVEEQG